MEGRPNSASRLVGFEGQYRFGWGWGDAGGWGWWKGLGIYVQLMVSSSLGRMSWKAVAVLERVVALKRVIALGEGQSCGSCEANNRIWEAYLGLQAWFIRYVVEKK